MCIQLGSSSSRRSVKLHASHRNKVITQVTVQDRYWKYWTDAQLKKLYMITDKAEHQQIHKYNRAGAKKIYNRIEQFLNYASECRTGRYLQTLTTHHRTHTTRRTHYKMIDTGQQRTETSLMYIRKLSAAIVQFQKPQPVGRADHRLKTPTQIDRYYY